MRRLQRFAFIVTALICPALAYAQGGVPASPIQLLGPTGRPLAGATVTVCTSAGTGFPCSPLASIFTDAGLTLPASNPVTTDGNGNLPVIFAVPGVYKLSVTGSGITSTLLTATVAGTGGGNVILNANNAFTGNNTHSGGESFNNFNALQWAGSVGTPGTPTIDQAIAAASTPGRVDISPISTSAESVNNVTTSTAYVVNPAPSPSSRLVVFDNRGSQASAPPMYSIGYGQKCVGEFTTECINYWTTGIIPDSTTTVADNNWIQGTFPSNNGSLQAHSAVVIVHDAITVGAYAGSVVGLDAEAWLDSTSQDAPIPTVSALNAQTISNRANSTTNATTVRSIHAGAPAKVLGGGTWTNVYSIDADGPSAGATRNYAYHSGGNFLFENNTAIFAKDSGGIDRIVHNWNSSNQQVFFSMADSTCCATANQWFKTQGGAGLFALFSNRLQSQVNHEFFGSILLDGATSGLATFTASATGGARTVNVNDTNGVASVSLPLLNSAGAAGIQTKRVASCTTGAAAGSTCTTTVTWTTAFADTNYTSTCTIETVTAVPYVLSYGTKAGASIVVTIANLTAVAASGTIDCGAQHD